MKTNLLLPPNQTGWHLSRSYPNLFPFLFTCIKATGASIAPRDFITANEDCARCDETGGRGGGAVGVSQITS